MITFKELKIYEQFTIAKEPDSVFYKEEDSYDGSCNAYKVKSKRKIKGYDMCEPVIFPKDYAVIDLK
jgi:hypothetical protein